MNRTASVIALLFFYSITLAQAPKTYSSAELLLQVKKLNVLGSVLYIAAHPDDENTRLLAYLANEKHLRTGYLSITRGDGGQNLIGDEQGIDLGLIRTQELLAARRNDGAEQFFTSAYDFGYSKSPEEALKFWGHEKVLGDVVWVIRKFRPDVIITRFPTTGEGGHGHHTASAILAGEAFDAAADTLKYPEQFRYGVTTWKAKRLLWNTFNFGNTNTQRDDQLKIDVGMFNPVLGKSYGEIAAESRSEHKSQGFGVPAQRGTVIEYFASIKGDKPLKDLMEHIQTGWTRIGGVDLSGKINNIIKQFNVEHPENSSAALLDLYKELSRVTGNEFWKKIKQEEVINIFEKCNGLFLEAVTENQLNVFQDSFKIKVSVNNRMGAGIKNIKVSFSGKEQLFEKLTLNETQVQQLTVFAGENITVSQPYWLELGLMNGSFEIKNPQLTGKAENPMHKILFEVQMENGQLLQFNKQILYKYTDPVKGELYEPMQIIHPFFIKASPSLIIFNNSDKKQTKEIRFTVEANQKLNEKIVMISNSRNQSLTVLDSAVNISARDKFSTVWNVNSDFFKKDSKEQFSGMFKAGSLKEEQAFALKKISYDHIPDIFYNYRDSVTVLKLDLKTAGKRAGYIPGAGDKIPLALEQMGYNVVVLNVQDLNDENLKKFDVIITGIRAYNVHAWLSNSYDALMRYVFEGGVLLTQYNTNNTIGPVKSRMAPYPFNISRSRVTDESAAVRFLEPNHPVLHFPNKITDADFEGWVQERSVYHAENTDSAYKKILGMHDPGEKEQDGSLIVADYGKGRFVYTGLAFFRELPAAVPGAFRLFANLIANERSKN